MRSDTVFERRDAVPDRTGDLGSMAVWLDAYSAVYVEIPKVACSSITIALASLLGIDLRPSGGDPHKARLPEPPVPPPGPTLCPGLFSFAFVRNPWEGLVARYPDKILGEVRDFTALDPARGVVCPLARFADIRPGMSFEAFFRAVSAITDQEADEHFRAQHSFVTNAAGELAIDYVGRFETLERDFCRMCATSRGSRL